VHVFSLIVVVILVDDDDDVVAFNILDIIFDI